MNPASQESMNRCWEFIDEIDENIHKLPKDEKMAAEVQRRFRSLAIANPPFQPYGTFEYPGVIYQAENDGAHPENIFYQQIKKHPVSKTITGITSFSFEQIKPGLVKMESILNGEPMTLLVPTDGTRRLSVIPEYYKSLVYISGYWKNENTFAIIFRWVETVFEKELAFQFQNGLCLVKEKLNDRRNPINKETIFKPL